VIIPLSRGVYMFHINIDIIYKKVINFSDEYLYDTIITPKKKMLTELCINYCSTKLIRSCRSSFFFHIDRITPGYGLIMLNIATDIWSLHYFLIVKLYWICYIGERELRIWRCHVLIIEISNKKDSSLLDLCGPDVTSF
jgi:hypothetical protein